MKCPRCGRTGEVWTVGHLKYMVCNRQDCRQPAGSTYLHDAVITHWDNPNGGEIKKAAEARKQNKGDK